jgi:hypothetical protein
VVRDPKGKPDALFFQRAVTLRVFCTISQLERLKSGKEPQPLDKDMKTAMLADVDELVEAAINGKSTAKKKVLKFVPYTRLPKDKLLKPPSPPDGEPSSPVPLAW